MDGKQCKNCDWFKRKTPYPIVCCCFPEPIKITSGECPHFKPKHL